MSKTVGRLKQKIMEISGEIDERTPSVTRGLTEHFPLDGTVRELEVIDIPQESARPPFSSLKAVWYQPYIDEIALNSLDFLNQFGSGGSYTNDKADIPNLYPGKDVILVTEGDLGNSTTGVNEAYELANQGYFVVLFGGFGSTTWGASNYYTSFSSVPSTVSHSSYVLSEEMASSAGKNNQNSRPLSDYNMPTALASDLVSLYYYQNPSSSVRYYQGHYKLYPNGGVLYAHFGEPGESNRLVQDAIFYLKELSGNPIAMQVDSDVRELNVENTTLTDDGIFVEEATTNLLLNSDFSANTNWTLGTNGTNASWSTAPSGTGAIINTSGYFGHYYYLRQTVTRAIAANTSITVSFTFKNDTVGLYGVRCGVSSDTANIGEKTTYFDLDGSGKPKRISVTYKPTVAGTKFYADVLAGGYYSYGGRWLSDNPVEILDAQAEEKSFATSYTKTSRAEGVLKIDNVLSPNRGTVVVDVTFLEDDTVNGLQGADQYCFGNRLGYNVANTFWFHDVRKWFIRDSDNVRSEVQLSSPMIRGERTHLALIYDDSDGTMDLYKNGVLSSSGAKVPAIIGKLGTLGKNWTHSGHAELTTYKMCQQVHGLSFYNVPLTADEIKKLHAGNFSFTKEGDFKTRLVEEKPVFPDDLLHFPLSGSLESVNYGKVKPITAENYFMNEEGLHLGKSISNLLANPTFSEYAKGVNGVQWDAELHKDALTVTGWSSGWNSGVTTPTTGYHAHFALQGKDGGPCIMMYDVPSNNRRWLGITSGLGTGTSLGLAVGTVLTISFDLWVDTPGKGISTGLYHQNQAGTSTFGTTLTQVTSNDVNKWVRKSVTVTVDADWKIDSSTTLYFYGNNGAAGIAKIENPQVVIGKASRFVDGTKGIARVVYPHEIISNTETNNANFSINFWFKMFEVPTWSLIGSWNKFYVGLNNGRRPIFSWMNREMDNTVIQKSILGDTLVEPNEWHMMTVTVDESMGQIRLYLDGVLEAEVWKENAIGIMSASYPMTSVSFAGDWSNFTLGDISPTGVNYNFNGIIRDLTLGTRILFEEEIEEMYKVKMRARKGGTTVVDAVFTEDV